LLFTERLVHWTTARFTLDLSEPRVMGIVNLTPDSFSDGGAWGDARAALHHAECLLREGAEVLDLGAESSRPGAPRVDADTEWERLAPVLREAVRMGVPVSVDTCKPAVMRRAMDVGADAINDIQALQAPGALEAVAAYPQVGVCLMHMRGDPGSMQQLTAYDDVVGEVRAALEHVAHRAQAAGVAADRIVLDPGFGFAKTPAQNLTLHAALPRLLDLGFPVLAGWSRKSTLGWVTGRPVGERLAASLAAALSAAVAGARLLRVHDVAATVDALRVWRAAGQWPAQATPGNSKR
jgi:dihydropteroate synthase